jgi:hypothetical protein
VTQMGETGPPVVLLHALGLDWRMWEPVMAPLAERRRVFAYDLRGHATAETRPAEFTMADAAADLVGVLDALGSTARTSSASRSGVGSLRPRPSRIPTGSSRSPCWRPPTTRSPPSRTARVPPSGRG